MFCFSTATNAKRPVTATVSAPEQNDENSRGKGDDGEGDAVAGTSTGGNAEHTAVVRELQETLKPLTNQQEKELKISRSYTIVFLITWRGKFQKKILWSFSSSAWPRGPKQNCLQEKDFKQL